MIVTKEHGTPDGSHVQSADDLLNDNVLRDDPSSLPPPYASASSSTPQPPVAPARMPDLLANQGLSRVQPPIAHCNNVAIKRATGKVSGSYVIDPELVIPVEMLAPLGEDEERKNFKIDVGSSQIDVDLWVSPPSARAYDTKHPRTTIDMRGHSVKLRLHNAGSRAFGLSANCSSGGNITLEIPRSFRGPLTIKSRSDRVTFSPALEPMVATFSDYDDLRKCFVGDFKALEFGQGAWEGSMIEIDGPYSRIHLRFADEPEPIKTPTSSWGIWPFVSPTTPVAKV